MQHLCASREKCRSDIAEKLRSLGLPEDDAAWVLHRLEEDHFIDEARFTGFFTRDKFRLNHWGKIRIRHALQQKNIDPGLISEALASISDEEYCAVLKQDLQRKNTSIKDPNVWSRKAKLLRFAAGRGFEQGLVYDMIDEILGKRE